MNTYLIYAILIEIWFGQNKLYRLDDTNKYFFKNRLDI